MSKIVPKKSINLEAEREKDRTPVRGIFNFHEVPGGRVEFSYKKYKGEKVENYDLRDGNIYTIPLGVARHLNKNGWYPVHMHAVDEQGKPLAKIGQKVRRFGFQSLEFIDIEDLSPEGSHVLTVEKVTTP